MASTPGLYFVAVFTLIVWNLPVHGRGEDIDVGITIQSHDSQHVIAQKNWKQLLLNCSVTSQYGTPRITWRKNGVPLNLANDNRIQKVQNGSLYFRKVIKRKKLNITDEGLYECLASNNKGTVLARRVQLEISGISRTFSLQPQDERAVEGGVARFECRIKASPPPLYTWLKDDQHLIADDRHIIISTGILQIINVRPSDAGQYWCKATPGKLHDLPDQVDSIKWKRSNPASLTITSGTTTRPLTIKAAPANSTVQEGRSVVLECLVDGTPKPKVTWQRADSSVPTSAVLYGYSYLKILQVTPSHAGVYVCTARSGGSTVTARASLDVHTHPVITQGPRSVGHPSAFNARFKCHVEGRPSPQVQWLINGTVVSPGANHQIKDDKTLVITGTVPTDSGYYQCIAENGVNYDLKTARLTIFPKENAPQIPQGVMAEAISSTEISISWTPAEAGSNPIIAYSVDVINHYDQTEKFNSLVRGVTHIQIKDLLPAITYEVFVRAYNAKGASDRSDGRLVTTFESEPSAAPMIRITKTTSNSMTMEWDELPLEQRNGVIVGYQIYYMKHGAPTIQYDEENDGDSKSFVLNGLEPDTVYHIRVLAGTNVGYPHLSDNDWPWVQEGTQSLTRQNDSVPDPPVLTVILLNATAVNVTWQQDLHQIPVTKYTVTLKRLKDPDQSTRVVQIPLSARYHILTNLQNETYYQVALTASNSFGDSGPVVEEFYTLENPPPPPPHNLRAMFLAARLIRVQWSQPDSTARVAYYRIRYWPWVHDSAAMEDVSYIRSNKAEVEIDNLIPYTYYYIDVQAFSGVMESKFSDPIIERTQEDVPSEPQNMEVQVTRGIALIKWDPPTFPNGNITTYIVRYHPQPDSQEWRSFKINGSMTRARIDNLKDGLYLIEITACTSAGQGPSSESKIHILSGLHKKPKVERPGDEDGQVAPQKLGIILGITIGIICIIICVLIILLRNKCFNNHPHGYPHVQAVRYHGNGHVPGHGNGHAIPVTDREMDPNTPMLDGQYENHLLDSKGCGSGNIIVTPNGTRVNGYVPFSNGLRNGHLHNGHVTTIMGYQNDRQQEETRGLIAAMLANDGNAVTDDLGQLYKPTKGHSPDKSSLDDIDKSDTDQNTSTGSADLPQSASCLDDGTTACCHDDDSGCHGENSSCPYVGTAEMDYLPTEAGLSDDDVQHGVRPPDPLVAVRRRSADARSPTDGADNLYNEEGCIPLTQLPPRAHATICTPHYGDDISNQSSTSVPGQHPAASTSTGQSELPQSVVSTSAVGKPTSVPTHENTSSFRKQPNNLIPSSSERRKDDQSDPAQGIVSPPHRGRRPYQQPPPPPYPGVRDLAMHRIPQDSIAHDHQAVVARRQCQDVAV